MFIVSWISTINLEPGTIPSGIVQANKFPSWPDDDDDTLITSPGFMPSGTITSINVDPVGGCDEGGVASTNSNAFPPPTATKCFVATAVLPSMW